MASEPDAAGFFADQVEFTADYVKSRQQVLVKMSFRGQQVWGREVNLSWEQVELKEVLASEEIVNLITKTMTDHMDAVATMHMVRLDAMFPRTIEKVELEYDAKTNARVIHVRFKNGHVATGTEAQSRTQDFLARCTMLHDLPLISNAAPHPVAR